MSCKALLLLVSFTILCPASARQDAPSGEPLLQLCSEYSPSGDLLEAAVSPHLLEISITRPTGQVVKLTDQLPDGAFPAVPARSVSPCQFAVSASSAGAALAVSTASGILVELLDLTAGKLTHSVRVPPRFPVQFALHPIGFIDDSQQLAVSQAHYLPSGEPEISTEIVGADGSVGSVPRDAIGPQYAKVSPSSFDFREDRVWFLCPLYSARNDRQPRCTLISASLSGASVPPREIPPPPDDRVYGSSQPSLGFPSPNIAVVLAANRFWVYNFLDRSFHQLNLPETPHYVRWFELPGQPKFSSDGCFAAVPVYMYHYPLFVEGQVSHGTKLVVVEMATLRILETFQPVDKHDMVDFALHSDGKNLKVVANWGHGWRDFQIPVSQASNRGLCR